MLLIFYVVIVPCPSSISMTFIFPLNYFLMFYNRSETKDSFKKNDSFLKIVILMGKYDKVLCILMMWTKLYKVSMNNYNRENLCLKYTCYFPITYETISMQNLDKLRCFLNDNQIPEIRLLRINVLSPRWVTYSFL